MQTAVFLFCNTCGVIMAWMLPNHMYFDTVKINNYAYHHSKITAIVHNNYIWIKEHYVWPRNSVYCTNCGYTSEYILGILTHVSLS